MIHVPPGTVSLGSEAKHLLEVTKDFHPRATRPREKLLRNLMSELGEKEVDVESFFLHRLPVTNEQYLQFVQATGHRFPFHWWKEGRKDDWEKRRAEAREGLQGPDGRRHDSLGELLGSAPVPDPRGHRAAPGDLRLPGSTPRRSPAGPGCACRPKPSGCWPPPVARTRSTSGANEWGRLRLKELKLSSTRDKVLKEVGVLGALARGPYGHEDMVANIWEWTSGDRLLPVATEASYQKELKKLKKNPATKDLLPPEWNGSKRILKGGSYFSYQEPPSCAQDPRQGGSNRDHRGHRLPGRQELGASPATVRRPASSPSTTARSWLRTGSEHRGSDRNRALRPEPRAAP